jgi:hypothetical protein
VAEASGLLLRSVRDLRRIHSHLASFAYPVLNRPQTPPTPSAEPIAAYPVKKPLLVTGQ